MSKNPPSKKTDDFNFNDLDLQGIDLGDIIKKNEKSPSKLEPSQINQNEKENK